MSRPTRSKYLRTTGHRRKRSSHLSAIVLLILLLGVAATVAYVWVRVQVVKQQMIIVELEAQIERLEADNEYLRMDLQRLYGASHLESVAKRYGFIYPRPHQIVRLTK